MQAVQSVAGQCPGTWLKFCGLRCPFGSRRTGPPSFQVGCARISRLSQPTRQQSSRFSGNPRRLNDRLGRGAIRKAQPTAIRFSSADTRLPGPTSPRRRRSSTNCCARCSMAISFRGSPCRIRHSVSRRGTARTYNRSHRTPAASPRDCKASCGTGKLLEHQRDALPRPHTATSSCAVGRRSWAPGPFGVPQTAPVGYHYYRHLVGRLQATRLPSRLPLSFEPEAGRVIQETNMGGAR